MSAFETVREEKSSTQKMCSGEKNSGEVKWAGGYNSSPEKRSRNEDSSSTLLRRTHPPLFTSEGRPRPSAPLSLPGITKSNSAAALFSVVDQGGREKKERGFSAKCGVTIYRGRSSFGRLSP